MSRTAKRGLGRRHSIERALQKLFPLCPTINWVEVFFFSLSTSSFDSASPDQTCSVPTRDVFRQMRPIDN